MLMLKGEPSSIPSGTGARVTPPQHGQSPAYRSTSSPRSQAQNPPVEDVFSLEAKDGDLSAEYRRIAVSGTPAFARWRLAASAALADVKSATMCSVTASPASSEAGSH